MSTAAGAAARAPRPAPLRAAALSPWDRPDGRGLSTGTGVPVGPRCAPGDPECRWSYRW